MVRYCDVEVKMIAPVYQPRFVEARYQPDQLVTAGPGRRLGGYLLDGLIVWCTLGIGWLVWFCFSAVNGQTPGKQLLGMYVVKADGTRAGGGYTWLREAVIKPVFSIISVVTFGVLSVLGALWCLWDQDCQCLWDKMASAYVAWSPYGYKPLTARELYEQQRTRASLPAPSAGGALADAPTNAEAAPEQSEAGG